MKKWKLAKSHHKSKKYNEHNNRNNNKNNHNNNNNNNNETSYPLKINNKNNGNSEDVKSYFNKINNGIYELYINTYGIDIHQGFCSSCWTSANGHPLSDIHGRHILNIKDSYTHIYIKNLNVYIYRVDELYIFNIIIDNQEHWKNNIFFISYNGIISLIYCNIKFLFAYSDSVYLLQGNKEMCRMSIEEMIYYTKNNYRFKLIKNRRIAEYINHYHITIGSQTWVGIEYDKNNINFDLSDPSLKNISCFYSHDLNNQKIIIRDKNLNMNAGYYNGKLYCILKCDTNITDQNFLKYSINNRIFTDEYHILNNDEILKIPENIVLSPLFKYSIDYLTTNNVKYLSNNIKNILFQMLMIKKYKSCIFQIGIILMIIHYLL